MQEGTCGQGVLIHYREPPWIIPGTLRGREVLHREDGYPRVPHGRRMR